jgi:tRNA1(Val) A37 N6-methylase TrmN6
VEDGEKIEELGGGIRVLTTRAHTFGTDALLLAAFALRCARPRAGARLCDLGTGCGVIPLWWCRAAGESPAFTADAVELRPEAAALAGRSAALSGLTGRVRVRCGDLKDPAILPRGVYDLVCCNPPYRRAGTGDAGGTPARRAARCENAGLAAGEAGAAAADFIRAASLLLKPGGSFCLCQRPERLCEILGLMHACGLEPKRLRLVQHRAGARPRLFLAEGRKGGRPGLDAEPVLLLESPGGAPSPELAAIYAGALDDAGPAGSRGS